MLVQILVVLLILAGTGFLVSQGILSNLLLFASAAFSSILAMGLYETLAPIFSAWRPDYANALAFFSIFIIAAGVIRLVAGILVPDNIPIEIWTDRVGAGILGFLTSMVAIGTTVIAADMLPLYDNYLGFDRYPSGMANAPSSLWIPADSFVLGLYRLASNGSLGGSSFNAVDPDLTRELYGYRHAFPLTTQLTVSRDLVKVPAAFIFTDPAQIKSAFGSLATDSSHILIVRTTIDHGDAGKKSSDPGNPEYLRFTPTQVRLLTSKEKSLYPIGYLDHGTRFTALDLDKSYTVDDYTDDNKVSTDWVFDLGDDEDPRYLEVKQFARVDIHDLPGKPNIFTPLKLAEYPPHAYIKDQASIQIVIKVNGPDGKPLDTSGLKVWIMNASTPKRNPKDNTDTELSKIINSVYDQLNAKDERTAARYVTLQNAPPEVPISISNVLSMVSNLYPAADKPEVAGRQYENFFRDKFAPMIEKRSSLIFDGSEKTDKSGATSVKVTQPLQNQVAIAIFVAQKPSYGFYLWCEGGVELLAKDKKVVTLTEKNSMVPGLAVQPAAAH